jgi:hypothetical protein
MAAIKRPGLHDERMDLIRRAIAFEPVERVPVAYIGMGFSPRYMGHTISEYVNSTKLQGQVLFDTLEKLDGIDALNQPTFGIPVGTTFSDLWLSEVSLPGRELPENSLWQIHEKEQMTVDDYDRILDMGWSKFKKKYLPRVGVSQFDVIKMMFTVFTTAGPSLKKFREAGYVVINGGIATIPFESLCGGRSMSKFYIDLFRMPDKIEAVMDVMLDDFIAAGLNYAKLTKPIGVWIGGWRSGGAMLGQKQWDRFVFPYMQKTATAFDDAGLISILHLDQDWTRDLERFKELPAKKCLLNPDGMTDVRTAREVLGDHMAIMGDIPASLFAAGTPEDMYKYVRELIRDVGAQGLILCPGCDAPLNTKAENMEAYVAAAKEFGVVTQ